MVARGARQNLLSDRLAVAQLIFKGHLHLGIGIELFSFLELCIIDEKLRLQNVHAIKFGEQVGSRIRYGTHWVFRMGALPGREGLVRRVEVEVIHLAIPDLKGGGIHRSRGPCWLSSEKNESQPSPRRKLEAMIQRSELKPAEQNVCNLRFRS